MDTSSTPLSKTLYLIRAVHQWIIDNGHTPCMLVQLHVSGTIVPAYLPNQRKCVLELAHDHVHGFTVTTDHVRFVMTGRPHSDVEEKHEIVLPLAAIESVFSKETGEGMSFIASDTRVFGPLPPYSNLLSFR